MRGSGFSFLPFLFLFLFLVRGEGEVEDIYMYIFTGMSLPKLLQTRNIDIVFSSHVRKWTESQWQHGSEQDI